VALPAVDYLQRHLGLIELVQAHVARNPDGRSGWRREGDERLMVPVVDIEQPGQLARRELWLGRQVTLIAGALAEAPERERDGPAVRSGELTDREAGHLTLLTRPEFRM
jgi:hypothetical protein